ncbi:MAG: AAA family ATPase [Myxococcota bacterium]
MPTSQASASAAVSTGWLVGRDRELALLHESATESFKGISPACWLLTGPPGIGKTAVAEGLARGLTLEGAQCHWGVCHDAKDAPAYWPWGDLLRRVTSDLGEATRKQLLAEAHPDVAQMIRAPGQTAAKVEKRAKAEPDEARFHFFDGVASFLVAAARIQPLLLVIDDLQWAAPAALDLTAFIARQLRGSRIAIVSTYRDVEFQQGIEADRTLADLARSARHLPLAGLSEDDVKALIEERSGSAVSKEFSRAVWDRTDGNPFFIDEMTRLMLHEGSLGRSDALRAHMPTQIETAIRQHLRQLPPALRELLSAASVIGKQFDALLLAKALHQNLSEVMRWIEDRSSRGVIELIGGQPNSVSFKHGLLQQCLYDDLEPKSRMLMHGRLLDVLSKGAEPFEDTRLGELTRHAIASGDRPADVVRYSTLTGLRAKSRYACLEAADSFKRALDALELSGGSRSERLELLLLRGEALLDHGDLATSAEIFELSFEFARETGDATSMARAAMGYSGGGENGLAARPDRAALLEHALKMLEADSEDNSGLRGQVLSRLAGTIYFSNDVERPISLVRTALDLARASGDSRSIGWAIDCGHWIFWRPDNAEERLALTEEYIGHAEAISSQALCVRAYIARFESLVELGRIAEAEAALDSATQMAAAINQKWGTCSTLLARSLLNTIRGNYAVAEDHAQAALDLGKTVDPGVAAEWYYVQLFLIREAQGRQGEILDMLRQLTAARPMPAVRAGLARMLAREGELDEARTHYSRLLAEGGVRSLRRDVNWPFIMGCLAELAVVLDDLPAAREIYDALLPYEGHQIILGLKLGWADGATLYLGMLAGALGRMEEAFAHSERALKFADQMNSAPARLSSEILRINLLLTRESGGDAEAAKAAMAQLEETAAELGIERRLESLRSRFTAASSDAASPEEQPSHPGRASRADADIASATELYPSSPSPRRASLTLQGDFWNVSYEGDDIRLRNLKGLQQLAILLREPGREFYSLDLLDPSGGQLPLEASTGAWLDDRARSEYKARVEDLRESLAEAEHLGDSLRASYCNAELDALAREISRHVGLGDRDRPTASGAEKARVNVTRTIRQAIAKIEADLPELARHLRNTVSTGLYSSYDPAKDGPAIHVRT